MSFKRFIKKGAFALETPSEIPPSPATPATRATQCLAPLSGGTSHVSQPKKPFATVATLTEPGKPLEAWDDRIVCRNCRHLNPDGLCLAAYRGQLEGPKYYHPVPAIPRRCDSYRQKAVLKGL